jgi:hypothetical protein
MNLFKSALLMIALAKGFASHSDQERLLETELHRFVRLNWDLVFDLVRAK